MKKLALALVCLVSVAFFASCDPTEILDPTPYLTVKTGSDYVSGTVDNPTIIALDDETNYKFGFHAESNASTKKGLTTLKIVKEYTLANGETGSSETTVNLNGVTTYDFEDNVFEGKAMYDAFIVRASLTDEGGQVKTVALAYKVEQSDALVAQPFAWKRLGTNNGTGLEQFGLKWNGNVERGFYASIKPLENASLYKIDDLSKWESITTETEKAAFFTELSTVRPIDKFEDIELSGYTNGTEFARNFLLATIYNGQTYLIRVRKTSTVAKANEWTITGEYK